MTTAPCREAIDRALASISRIGRSEPESPPAAEPLRPSILPKNYLVEFIAGTFGPAASGQSLLERPTEGGVSSQFDYLSDLPIDRWGGIELRPFVDSTGIDFHGGSNGNTVVGGTNDSTYSPQPVDLETGSVSESGVILRPADVHHTLLTAAGLSADHINNQNPVTIDAMLKS